MKITIQTTDNITLHAELLLASNPKAVVLINPGTATKTSFYRPFAQFLQEAGYHVVLWNYRGFCESKSGSLKNSPFKYSDIGFYDIAATISKIKELYPDLPLYLVGHSAGAQQLGLANNYDRVDKYIVVAASGGYYPYMPLSYRFKAIFFFYLFSPFFSFFFKYVPAKKFDLMEDLPTPLVIEWRNWCREKDFFFSPKYYGKTIPLGAYKDFKMPIYLFFADDDEISTKKNIDAFWSNVKSTKPMKFKFYNAKDFPQKRIGHFGYFKKINKEIWNDILEAIKE